MGGGVPFGLMMIALLVILVLVSAFVVVPWLRGESRRQARLTEPGDSLVYEVPEGQDPAAIIAALRQDGLEATEVMRQGRQRVVIGGPGGSRKIRAQAQVVIAHESDLNLEGDPAPTRKVTFADE